MAKGKKEKLRDIAVKGQFGGEISQEGNLSATNGHIYREFGDLDSKDVIDHDVVSYRGTGYSQVTTNLGTFTDVIQRAGLATTGDYIRWRRGIYKITGSTTTTEQKF